MLKNTNLIHYGVKGQRWGIINDIDEKQKQTTYGKAKGSLIGTVSGVAGGAAIVGALLYKKKPMNAIKGATIIAGVMMAGNVLGSLIGKKYGKTKYYKSKTNRLEKES